MQRAEEYGCHMALDLKKNKGSLKFCPNSRHSLQVITRKWNYVTSHSFFFLILAVNRNMKSVIFFFFFAPHSVTEMKSPYSWCLVFPFPICMDIVCKHLFFTENNGKKTNNTQSILKQILLDLIWVSIGGQTVFNFWMWTLQS